MKSKKRQRRNPYRGEHSARLRSPRGFTAFRRQNNRFGPGRHVIFGLRRGRAVVLALRFDSRRYSPKAARAWLRRHKLRCLEFRQARRKPRPNPACNPKITSRLELLTTDQVLAGKKIGWGQPIKTDRGRIVDARAELKPGDWIVGRRYVPEKELNEIWHGQVTAVLKQKVHIRPVASRDKVILTSGISKHYGASLDAIQSIDAQYFALLAALAAKRPVLVEPADKYRITVPLDYTRDGERYVFKAERQRQGNPPKAVDSIAAGRGNERLSNPKPPKLGTIWPYGAKIKVIEGNMWKTISVVADLPPAINNEILKLRRRGVRDLWVFHAWGEKEYVGNDKLSGEQREQQRQSKRRQRQGNPQSPNICFIEREDGGLLALAQVAGKEVGIAIITNLGGGNYEMNEVRVTEAMRRSGIGSMLYVEAASEVRRRGGQLWTSPELTESGKALTESLDRRGVLGEIKRISGAHRHKIIPGPR